MVAAYDVNAEPPPNCPVYHPSFKIVTAKFDEILRLLRGPLDESNYTDSNVEGLISLLKTRSKARFPDEVHIALVGDMASGKSSLINSLLSVGILARKVCSSVALPLGMCSYQTGRCRYKLHMGYSRVQGNLAKAEHPFQSRDRVL